MTSIEQAKEILSKCLFVSVDNIADDAVITDIKPFDSLAFETLMMEVEDATGRDIDPMQMLDLKTVSDLARVLESGT